MQRHGKVMIPVLLASLVLPAALGGVQVVRMLLDVEELNPPLDPYRQSMDRMKAALGALDQTLVGESTLVDWATWRSVAPPPPAVETPSPPAPSPEIKIEYRLQLDGIVWKIGEPYAFINRKLAGLNDTVDGCTVTHIDPDTVILVDPLGRELRFNLDEELLEQYPGYRKE